MTSVDVRRRQFLAWAGQGMAWMSLGGLAACGGGGGDGGGGGGDDGGEFGGGGATGGGTPGTAVSPELRASTLESVRVAVAGLAAGGASVDSTALARAMQALPGLARVGISSAVGNVWAEFTDGRYLVVASHLEPSAATGASRVQPAAATRAPARERTAGLGSIDMPAKLVAQQYRQLDMLGAVPSSGAVEAAHLCQDWVDANTLPALRRMAVGCGFVLPSTQTDQPPDAGWDNGIDGLKDVRGDGVFFITGSAAQVGSDATPRTVICSATVANEANLARHEADLASGLLVYAVAMRGVEGAWQPVPCLAFGPEFVGWHQWRFPTESIAIFNLSGAPSMSDWIDPLYRAGVRHIMLWTRPVPWQKLIAFGDDLIQLNLATNNFDGTHVGQNAEPRLRSYGMGESLGYLMQRGVASDGAAGTALTYLQEGTPPLMVNSLLPTISYATINENTLALELVGQFGHAADGAPVAPTPGGAPTVAMQAMLVAGTRTDARYPEPLLARAADPLLADHQPLAFPTWQGELLQTRMREDELARGGYLQVVNGGRCSNAVPITHWEIPIRAVTTIDALTLEVTITLRLRADVHGWRLDPRGFARNGAPQGPLTGSVHSRMDFVASGSIEHYDSSTRTRTTISWSGQGGLANAIGAFVVNFSAMLMWDSRETMLVSIAVGHAALAHAQRTVTERFDINGQLLSRAEATAQVPVELTAVGPGLSGMLQWSFDEQWNLRAGSFEMLPQESQLLPAPPTRMRVTRLSWPEVRPDFAPRPDFGGT